MSQSLAVKEEASSTNFPDTHWTLIKTVGQSDESLQTWCRGYWHPIRSYIQAQGFNEEMAGDLTQRFFERILSKDREAMLPQKLAGAFRAYLKRSVKNFLTDVWRTEHAQKRGNGVVAQEFQDEWMEGESVAPDTIFERAWVLTLMQRALDALEAEMTRAGKEELFSALASCLDGKEPEGQAAVAERLGMNSGHLRVSLHRMRQRYRTLIEQELRETVSSQGEMEEEIRNLLTVWS